ncbi:MAG: M24 family metallopeptidase [Planctomycetes bacterium]|nr:M24 family metallopeptidase [Planctomycetota bacterium]
MADFDLSAVQAAIREFGFDGWLMCDFRGSNPLARRILKIDEAAHATRRFCYFIPASGTPQKLVHQIEAGVLDHLPGEKEVYLRWQELEEGVARLMTGQARVAMEYSPRNAIPYVGRVDAGTIELVRSAGTEVVSSGDLIQVFEAAWTDEQWNLHQQASRLTLATFDRAWSFIAEQVRSGGDIRETTVQQLIMDQLGKGRLVTDHPPIVAVGPHSGNPHFAPTPGPDDAPLRKGDYVLIDLWAKRDAPHAVYSDLTRVGYLGESVPDQYERIFQIVASARDAAIDRVRKAMAADEPLQGFQVDDAAREVIEQAGYGDYFVHRTGHSIGQETHGNGANIDNLETHETRRILPRTCFSIEPGIYLPEFGVRSEVDVFINANRQVIVTGDPQTQVPPVLAKY